MILLLKGAAKWTVYQDALGDGPILEAPIRGILHQNQVPVAVYWTP